MDKWWHRSSADRRLRRHLAARAVSLGTLVAVGLSVAFSAGAQQSPPAAASSLLQQAVAAEAKGQFDAALDRLYTLEFEYPRTADALAGRASLARLLALQGDLPSALLQAQALRDELPADQPERQGTLDLTTLLARRLRAKTGAPFYPAPELLVARGMVSLDEPTAVVVEPAGALLVLDQGANRLYRVAGDSTATLNVTQEPTAVAALTNGTLVVGGKNGLVASPPGLVVPAAGTWGGKSRPIRRIRSVAANSHGDLFVVDRDYDGLLRCAAGAASCAPWGPPGKLRVVKVGPSDLVLTLDDRQLAARVLDDAGKLVTTFGPTIGAIKLEKVVDIAMDRAYGVYLLDGELRRVDVGALRAGADGRFTVDAVGGAVIPPEGDRALKNPSALAVTPEGTLVVAGRGTSQLLRFR